MQIAWLFPGQGAQAVGMGKDLAATSKAARDVFARVDEALGEPLSRLIFEGPEEELTLTANAQPAMVATSMAALAAIREAYPDAPRPSFAAGHSLGEYSALIAAGALTLEDGVRLVRARGEAMQNAVPAGEGTMAAIVGVEAHVLEKACEDARAATGDVVSCANFNAPGQVVIAGTTRAVGRVSDLFRTRGERGSAIPLRVSAPFHCALMAPAAQILAAHLAPIAVQSLAFPVVANVTAQPVSDPAKIKALLVAQVDSAVRWEASIRELAAQGVTHAVEIGPGKVLAGLCRRITKDMKVVSVGDVASVKALGAMFTPAPIFGSGDTNQEKQSCLT